MLRTLHTTRKQGIRLNGTKNRPQRARRRRRFDANSGGGHFGRSPEARKNMFCDFFRERGVEAVYRDVTLIRRHHWLEGGPLMRKSRTFLELYRSMHTKLKFGLFKNMYLTEGAKYISRISIRGYIVLFFSENA